MTRTNPAFYNLVEQLGVVRTDNGGGCSTEMVGSFVYHNGRKEGALLIITGSGPLAKSMVAAQLIMVLAPKKTTMSGRNLCPRAAVDHGDGDNIEI